MTAQQIRESFGGSNGNGKHESEADETARLDAILNATKFDLGKPPARNKYVFTITQDGRHQPISYPGCLGLVMGAEKTRKTTLFKALAAAAIAGKPFLNFNFDMGDEGQAVFIDTEQQESDFWVTQSHVHYLAGLVNNTERYAAFSFLNQSIEDRFKLIERFIEINQSVKMIVIDGALDLINDFNNIKESREATERLTRIANKSGAVIFVCIHASAKTGKFAHAIGSLGHFGAFLQRKCKFALQLTYNVQTHFTEVKHALARGTGRFASFEFTNDKDGYPILDHNHKVELPQIAADGSIQFVASTPKDDIPF